MIHSLEHYSTIKKKKMTTMAHNGELLVKIEKPKGHGTKIRPVPGYSANI